jgi:hypothetical protein
MQMHWITKTFPHDGSYSADQDLLGKLQMRLAAQGGDAYRHVTMAARSEDLTDDVYIGLPRKEFAVLFQGYLPVTVALPEMTTLLLGEDSVWPQHLTVREPGG